jgi:hypothetical protein
MAHSHKFRRRVAQALSLDRRELHALIERILPVRDGKRVLCLATDADRRAAPMVIAGAVALDAIGADAADALTRQAESAAASEPAEAARGTPRENDPLAAFFRSLAEVEPTRLVVQGDRLVRVRVGVDSCCGAADAGEALVNINENTSAEQGGDAAARGPRNAEPVEIIEKNEREPR